MQTNQISASVPSPFDENSSHRIQFFVRLFSSGKTLVVQVDPMEKVEKIHEKIRLITGIPISIQRLIYKGKQLQLDQTISNCGIEKESNLQLVGRLRSTEHPHAWKLMDDLSSLIRSFYERNYCLIQWNKDDIESMFMEFLKMIWHDFDQAHRYVKIFISSSVPTDLVMLYLSSPLDNKIIADSCIRHVINLFSSYLSMPIYSKYAILLEFCKILRKVGIEDDLYIFCRSNFGTIIESIRIMRCKTEMMKFISLQDVYPFIGEIATQLYNSLNSAIKSIDLSLLSSLVHDFGAFMLPVRHIISLIEKDNGEAPYYRETIECLHHSFHGLLEATLSSLGLFVTQLDLKEERKDIEIVRWSLYVKMLKELNDISKLYTDLELVFWQKMRHIKTTLCFLIVKFATKSQDFGWIFEHKEVTNFQVRRHLAMMMLPEVRDQEIYNMLIDRSKLLEKSFKYIESASPEKLQSRLFIKFKHEEAIGRGVVREWFLLVCQEIFNPHNALFVVCPSDRKRFFPNLASKVKPLHLNYFCFSGRMIALALMHKVQIGIAFDRSFFLQLAGKDITLEDVKDADPPFYSSCKKILEMDPEMIDGDNLCLRFSCDVDSMGNRIEIELCPNGKDTIVDSKNREKYIHLLVQHYFVASLADQIQHFARGFADITSMSMHQLFFQHQSFFRCLSLEDLDVMLGGSGSNISVEDWKAHTDYLGFEESDSQISWFWKIVECMSVEQRNVLLFFWTSIKFLPPNGFAGLSSRLQICKNWKPYDHLPSSQTCFNQISFPAYKSESIMQDRFGIITQEHVGCSFGNL